MWLFNLLIEKSGTKEVYCVATVAHCCDGSVYKRVFYCYFGVKMRECISLGGKEVFWLDLIILINHTVYCLEKFWNINQSCFFLSAFESYLLLAVKMPRSVNIYEN